MPGQDEEHSERNRLNLAQSSSFFHGARSPIIELLSLWLGWETVRFFNEGFEATQVLSDGEKLWRMLLSSLFTAYVAVGFEQKMSFIENTFGTNTETT